MAQFFADLTLIASQGTFYTNSNGHQFMQWQCNYQPSWNLNQPVVGNFYPINAAMYLQEALASMAVVVHQSQGGVLLHDGALELMVQHGNLADDDKVVAELLNETCDPTLWRW